MLLPGTWTPQGHGSSRCQPGETFLLRSLSLTPVLSTGTSEKIRDGEQHITLKSAQCRSRALRAAFKMPVVSGVALGNSEEGGNTFESGVADGTQHSLLHARPHYSGVLLDDEVVPPASACA